MDKIEIINEYAIDFSKVNTLEDIKKIIEHLGITFYGEESIQPIKEYVYKINEIKMADE